MDIFNDIEVSKEEELYGKYDLQYLNSFLINKGFEIYNNENKAPYKYSNYSRGVLLEIILDYDKTEILFTIKSGRQINIIDSLKFKYAEEFQETYFKVLEKIATNYL